MIIDQISPGRTAPRQVIVALFAPKTPWPWQIAKTRMVRLRDAVDLAKLRGLLLPVTESVSRALLAVEAER